MAKLNNIDVYICMPTNYWNDSSELRWSKNSFPIRQTNGNYFSDHDAHLVLNDINVLDKSIKDKESTLDNVEKLFFSPATDFPRFKIKDTIFKRVIKTKNADCVIIPKLSYRESSFEWEIYEETTSEGIIYKAISEPYFVNNMRGGNSKSFAFMQRKNCDFVTYLQNTGYLSKNVKFVWKGYPIVCHGEKMAKTLEGVLDDYPKLFYDSDLDKCLNKTLDPIDKETLNSLNDMLSSSDAESVELGIKILQNLNVSESPLSVATLLALNDKQIKTNKAKSTVGFKQVLETLNMSNFYFDINPWQNAQSVLQKKHEGASLEDRQMAIEIVKPHIEKAIRKFLQAAFKDVGDYGIKINFSVE